MNFFLQQYRKFIFPVALLLVIMLSLAIQHYRSQKIAPSENNNSVVQTGKNNSTAGMVRAGVVGLPLLVPVNSGFSGSISELYVTEGQLVKAGQPLFKLEPAPRRADTEAPKSGLSSSSPLTAEKAQIEYNRLKKLYEQGVISKREFESAGTRLQITRGNTPSGQQASQGVAPTVTTAPIEGIVTGLVLTPGSAVEPDQCILSLGGGHTLEVVIPLEQNELYWVQPGTSVTVEISGHTIEGEVSSILPEVKDTSTVSFLARISLTNPPSGLLQAGMSANVRIELTP